MSAATSRSTEPATRVAVVAALSATVMLFTSLGSAYLVRRSFPDWTRAPVAPWPPALLACALWASFGLEAALRGDEKRRRHGLRSLAVASTLYLFGALFVVMSIVRSEGLMASPHHAFIVLLLSLHIVHAALGATFAAKTLRAATISESEDGLPLVRLVTHFLTALLAAIIFLLFVVQ